MKSELVLNEPAVDWLREATGSTVLRAERLVCGPMCPVFLIETSADRFALRLYVDEEWRQHEPDLPLHEETVLQLVSRMDVSTPSVVASTSDPAPFGYPALLMTYVNGRVDLTPEDPDAWLDQIADVLAAIHSLPYPDIPWHHQRELDPGSLEIPSWTSRTEAWRTAIHLLHTAPQRADDVFLHGDFHPVNLLWRDGSLLGIIDWTDGELGPAAVDVAACATNLCAMYGPEPALAFHDKYAAASGRSFKDPFWNLEAIYGWAATPEPGFYPPWASHGLDDPGKAELRDRFDRYLVEVVKRI